MFVFFFYYNSKCTFFGVILSFYIDRFGSCTIVRSRNSCNIDRLGMYTIERSFLNTCNIPQNHLLATFHSRIKQIDNFCRIILLCSLFFLSLFSLEGRGEKNIISINLFPFFHSIQYLKCFHVAPTWLKLTYISLPYCVYIGEVQDLGLDLLREVFVLLDPRATGAIDFSIHILE